MSQKNKQVFVDKIISKLTPSNLLGIKDSKVRQSLTTLISTSDQKELENIGGMLYNKVWRNPNTNITRLSNFGFLMASEVLGEPTVKFNLNQNFNKNLILASRKLSGPYWVDSSRKIVYLFDERESSIAILCGSFDKFINKI